MIDVLTFNSTGAKLDEVEAETPADAIVAARTLLADARANLVDAPTASFYVAGKLVRSRVTTADLACWAAL